MAWDFAQGGVHIHQGYSTHRNPNQAAWNPAHGHRPLRVCAFVAPRHPPVSTKTEPLALFNQPLNPCRPDLVGFVNGLPLLVIELKKPRAPARAAFDENLTHYKQRIPALFRFSGLLIASNGTDSRVGSIPHSKPKSNPS